MLVDILVLILILLVTAYYANQGLFSATLSLIAAIFGSVLAMGLFEPLEGLIGSYKPAYARGLTFLLLFLFALSACRIGADFAVPKAIRFSKVIDSISGAVVGFFAALVIVGSCLIGVGMLPLHSTLLNVMGMGFDRYPGGMTAAEPGVPESPRNVWFMPDRFTETVWNGVSGRSLGGASSFDSVHPDLTVESYGYRNSVEYKANSVLVPDLLKVPAAYVSDAPDLLAKCDIKDPGKEAVVVRIEVTQGTDPPKISADEDGKFRITASQIRLITDRGQHYPIGHLENGIKFEPLPLDSGHLVDDYVDSKVYEDWVFEVDKDDKPPAAGAPPWQIEVKQLARADVKLLPKPAPALAKTAYPKRLYRLNHATLNVVVSSESGPIKDAKIYLVPETTKVGDVKAAVSSAYEQISSDIANINNAVAPWSTEQGKPGVPGTSDLLSRQSQARNYVILKANDDEAQWSEVISTMIMGACKPDGQQNVTGLPLFFNSNVVKLLEPSVRAQKDSDALGKATLADIAPGSYALIVSGSTAEGYYLWTVGVKLEAKSESTKALTPAMTIFRAEVKK